MVGGLEVEVGRRGRRHLEGGLTGQGHAGGGRGRARWADDAGHGAETVSGTAWLAGGRPLRATGAVAAGAGAGRRVETQGGAAEPAELPKRKRALSQRPKGKNGIHPVPRARAVHLKTNHPSKCLQFLKKPILQACICTMQ